MPDDVKSLPRIPRIENEDLRTRVFTHKSVAGMRRGAHQSEDEDPQDNERLCFLGDSVLQYYVTRIIYERSARHRRTRLHEKRALILNQTKLAEWATEYGLPQQLRVHWSTEEMVKSQPSVKAALFEAYVGAVVTQVNLQGRDGFAAAAEWLVPLCQTLDYSVEPDLSIRNDFDDMPRSLKRGRPDSPGVGDAYMDSSYALSGPSMSAVPMTPPAALRSSSDAWSSRPVASPPSDGGLKAPIQGWLSLLNERASQRRKTILWDELPSGQDHMRDWTVICKLDGFELARSTSSTKKDAKHIAARDALQKLGWATQGFR